MKLIVILSIAEYRKRLSELLQGAGISRFSSLPITGYKQKKENMGRNWFGSVAGQEVKSNSILLFSFAPADTASQVVDAINRCNEDASSAFPAHAFVLDVEQYSNLL